MLKWLAICVVAVAIAKWGQNVQANDELNENEKRLLQQLEDEFAQVQAKREMDDCESVDCFLNDECAGNCCEMACTDDPDIDACVGSCMEGGLSLRKRMAFAARDQEIANDEVNNNNNNEHDKKIFGIRIPPVRIPPVRIPPIPPVRRWVPPVRVPPVRIPPIPPVRRWVPPVRIPPVRVPSIPPVRRWFGKK